MHRTERDRVPNGLPPATAPAQLIITVTQEGRTTVTPDAAPPVAPPAQHAGPDRLFNAPATMRGQLNLEGT